MSAPVISLADRHVTREERRRASTLWNIGTAMEALRMTAQHTIPVLGNIESAEALEAFAKRLELETARAKSLAQEFRELAAEEPPEDEP